MPPDPRVYVGVGAVIERRGEILLVQRGSRASYADGYGTWALPGGWLEWGERAEDAAVREVFEETAVYVRALGQDGYAVDGGRESGLHVVTLFVRCEFLDGDPVNAEPEKQLQVRWMPREHLVELDLFAPLDAWWRRPR